MVLRGLRVNSENGASSTPTTGERQSMATNSFDDKENGPAEATTSHGFQSAIKRATPKHHSPDGGGGGFFTPTPPSSPARSHRGSPGRRVSPEKLHSSSAGCGGHKRKAQGGACLVGILIVWTYIVLLTRQEEQLVQDEVLRHEPYHRQAPVAASCEFANCAQPRTWPLDYASLPVQRKRKIVVPDAPPRKELRAAPRFRRSCLPKSAWHSYSFPTCNSMHELDFEAGLGQSEIEYKFSGGTRESWLLTPPATKQVILKTLRWPIAHDEVVFDHQRIDALASERLTASPHVIDIYGYCGMSAINEYADGGNFGKMHENLVDTTCPAQKDIPEQDLLVYARDAALGLADVHEIDGPNATTTLIHHDFSAKNFLTVNGKIKVSDFNDGQLLRWNFEKDKRCWGFNWDGLCGTSKERTSRRAPEECMSDKERYGTTEKTEVHHLGSFFFFLLTANNWPFTCERTSSGKNHKPKSSKVKQMILNGTMPTLPVDIEESDSPAIKAIVKAMHMAFTFDPKKRPSAREIAASLNVDSLDKQVSKAIA